MSTNRVFGGPVIQATGGVPVESRDVNREESRQIRSAEVHDATGGAAIGASRNDRRSMEEKTTATIASLNRKPRARELLYDLLVYCRDERSFDEAECFVADHPARRAGDSSPRTVVGILLRSGGLDQIDYDADGTVITEQRLQETLAAARAAHTDDAADGTRATTGTNGAAEIGEATGAVDATGMTDMCSNSDEQGNASDETGAAKENDSTGIDDTAVPPFDERDVLDDLVDHSSVIISQAGQNALGELDPDARVHALTDGCPERTEVYRLLLETLEQGPCRFEKLSQALQPALDALPVEPSGQRLQASYFIDALNAADGIRWTARDGWRTTDAGTRLLATLRDETSVACADAMKIRATVYRLLASLYFNELTEGQIEHIHRLDPFSFDGFDPLFAEGLHDIERSLRRPNSGTREELAVDYAHSILGAGGYEERRATPFESVFTSEAGLLMQDARDQVLALFRAERLVPNPALHVPEDHLSFIFEFMAALCDRFVAALEQGDRTEARRNLAVQRQLHNEHLANWIDAYCDVLDRVALTRFYRGVSKITRSFVHMDSEILADMTIELEGR